MNSWVFYLTDSIRTMTAVFSAGANRADGGADAHAGLCTSLPDSDMPGLLL